MKTRSECTANKAMILAMTALIGAGAASCSKKKTDGSDGNGGTTLLEIQTGGATINAVDWTITGPSSFSRMGTIDVSNPGSTASVLVTGLPGSPPPGLAGYAVTMTADSTPAGTHCTGTATFSVITGQTNMVTVVLQCRAGNSSGGIIVNGQFDSCPALTSYSASPLQTAPGGTVNLTSAASDADAADTVTYAWTADGGSFSTTTAASTVFTCPAAAGVYHATITVTDSKCTDMATITLTCISAALCGNHTLDPGEQCDPASGSLPTATCDSNCQIIPVCGDGVLQGGAPGPYALEQCDPPMPGFCSATCQTVTPVCGDGYVQAGEQCEPPNTATCSATCQNIAPPACGDHLVNQVSEQCDPAGTLPVAATSYAAGCDVSCQNVASLCSVCEAGACNGIFGAGNWGSSGLSAADLILYNNLINCVRTTHCSGAGGDIQPCYCGTASDSACLGGSANGACKSQVEAAAKSTDAGTIAGEFVDPTFPVGRVANELTCDATSCGTQCPLP